MNMKSIFKRKRPVVLAALLAVVLLLGWSVSSWKEAVDFNAQIKPILNNKCISCHGGVKQEGGFSLLFREEALDTTRSGKYAIVPGHPDKSELMHRILSDDPDVRMPYMHDPLPEEEIEVLRQWIREGAKWGDHWAYIPVKPVNPPSTGGLLGIFGKKPAFNEVDAFITNKLDEFDLEPSPLADKATLLRRVSLDLTGVPASEDIARQFFSDESPEAYEKLVDTLLSSPLYGERWAAMWLDMARYADSKGYEKDDYRSIWRYRDWLIKAFNSDMPYDRFLIEQLAGDLLPGATDEQYIATAFHRNTMNNDEGGTDNEEFRTAAVMDRVNTTWEVLMSTTFACVQCHTHPYDPFKFDEYYKFMAFFNNSRDEDTPDEYPVLREFKSADSLKLEALKAWLIRNAPEKRVQEIVTFLKTWQPSINSILCDEFVNSELTDTKWLAFRNNATSRLAGVELTGKNKLIFRVQSGHQHGTWTIYADSVGGRLLATVPLKPTSGWEIRTIDIDAPAGRHDLYFTYRNPSVPASDQSNLVRLDWFHFTSSFPGEGAPGYDTAFRQFNELVAAAPAIRTPIMMDNPPEMLRTTNVFVRGNWLEKGQEVQPDVPASMNPFPEGAPRNRLGLARWLTDKQNPLTSRTITNRIWEQLMGQGIAETLEDLGTQGIPPTHYALLDWMSGQLMNEYDWSLKKLIKTIVMSRTYQQASSVTPEMLEKDPFNKYYARGPRIRLSAEQIRDQGLAVSGLLSPKMYGKSVMPYQPDGVWLSPYAGSSWTQSEGEDQYRRALYTYWKRTAPYPALLSFDGVAREVCVARRIRTNTPLQALTLLNDESFMEMARHFAARMKAEGGDDITEQISRGYEIAMYKPIDPAKQEALEKLYQEGVEAFTADPAKAAKLINRDSGENDPHSAALILVANAMLNLDEFVTIN